MVRSFSLLPHFKRWRNHKAGVNCPGAIDDVVVYGRELAADPAPAISLQPRGRTVLVGTTARIPLSLIVTHNYERLLYVTGQQLGHWPSHPMQGNVDYVRIVTIGGNSTGPFQDTNPRFLSVLPCQEAVNVWNLLEPRQWLSPCVHTLQATKHSSAVDLAPTITATPTGAATTGTQSQPTMIHSVVTNDPSVWKSRLP
jgi:hypothetical protein